VISGDLLDRLATTDRPMATLALNSGLWVRRLLMGGSPVQGQYPASEVNDGTCPEKPVHLTDQRGETQHLARRAAFTCLSRSDACNAAGLRPAPLDGIAAQAPPSLISDPRSSILYG
jgi:hypothetical protein